MENYIRDVHAARGHYLCLTETQLSSLKKWREKTFKITIDHRVRKVRKLIEQSYQRLYCLLCHLCPSMNWHCFESVSPTCNSFIAVFPPVLEIIHSFVHRHTFPGQA